MAAPPTPLLGQLSALGEAPGKVRCTEALSPKAGPVCVTGATGFIALHLVSQLLEKGYAVVATVRSAGHREKMAPLLELQGKFGGDKLRVVGDVDCLKPETFDAAVAGCAGVFHTASPFHFKSSDPLVDLVPPAVEGTRGCLAACMKAGCVRRVVVTSSFASMFNAGKYPWDYTYTSKDWNEVSRPDAAGKFPEPAGPHGYRYSKLMAEAAAWDFSAKDDCPFDVACICPPMVIGHNYNKPGSVDDLNTSSASVLKLLTGLDRPGPNSMGFVDAADVARSHISAYEHPEAGGRRFLCTVGAFLWTEIAQMLKDLYPAMPVVTDPPAGGPGLKMGLDTSGLKSLSNFAFTPIRDTLKRQCDSYFEQGFAKL